MKATQWYTAATMAQMTDKQRVHFEKSFASYENYYDRLIEPAERKLNKSEYFEEYKQVRKDRIKRGQYTRSMPQAVAKEQEYARSLAQDKAQFELLHDREDFKKLHGDLIFKEFRRLPQEALDNFIWNEINDVYYKMQGEGKSQEEIRAFIGKKYFDSVV